MKNEQNFKKIETFEQLNQKYISIQKQYANDYQKLNNDIENRVHRREYSKGGEGFHRGFYSPSMTDLVIGGINRGKLLKKTPKDKNYNYEYLFDEQNNLICVYSYSNVDGVFKLVSTEFLLHQQNKTLSLGFNSDILHGLSFISECQYENEFLVKYENVLCDLFCGGKGCIEINVEIYDYSNNLMHALNWFRYSPSIKLLDQDKYIFNRDEQGYLSNYIIEDSFNQQQTIYKVRVKRK